MPFPSRLRNFLILFFLLFLIGLPPAWTGKSAENVARLAEQQNDPARAARLYELAARHLPWRPVLWQQAGLAALSAGEAEEAVRLLDEARQRGALTFSGQIALGQALWQGDRKQEAVTVWESTLAASGPDPELLGHLIKAYHALGRYADEQKLLQCLLSIHPQDAEVHYRLALLLSTSQPESALKELMEAIRLNPILDTKLQPMRRALNLALLSDEPAYRLTVTGQGLAAVDEWDLARQAFVQAVRFHPAYAEAWAWLGEADQHLGRDGTAALEQAEALNPDSALVQVFLGLHDQRQGHTAQAVQHFWLAANLEPENAIWQAALAEAYVQDGNLPLALDAYQRAVQIDPREPQYWRMLAAFCAVYEYQISEIGLPAARRALELSPGDAQALDVMGQIYLALGNQSLAENYFQQAIKADPALAEAYLHLGVIYLQTGQMVLAREAFQHSAGLAAGMPVGEQAQMLLRQYFP